ncbi:ATP-binding protein [Glaciibacter flavus]|uniref:ATP-binding protein n=1 Tax=Orlajensenia flava TaxID=2565934 RepID=A0A4S4G172_9MICO|nr:ATP-binding protein [Glaciibacter flavus]THG36411.1 ATP-binding protein [Glaciibacter flavus]
MSAEEVGVGAPASVRALLSAPERRPVLSATRIDAALSRAAGAFGLLFGAQTVPVMLQQMPAFSWWWGWIVAGAIVVGILAVAVATLSMRAVGAVCGSFAGLYLIVVVAWPFVVSDPTVIGPDKPWVWYLITVATVSAALAYPIRVAAVYTVSLPIAYLFVRLTPDGGAAPLGAAALDAVYSIVLGSAALVIVSLLRQTSSAVDAAQSAALERYAEVARHDAREAERVQVDALVHDSVLTTLLAAASATSPEQARLAEAMADAALERLQDVDDGDQAPSGGPVAVDQVVRRIRAGIASAGGSTVVHTHGLRGQTLPPAVAEALFSAAVQALVNSAQHAGAPGLVVDRRIDVSRVGDGCSIVVADTGVGFDPATVPRERMGLRVSIRERMAGVGGSSVVRSRPGDGAVIELHWPSREPQP